MGAKNIISQHIFMFPFRIGLKDGNKDQSPDIKNVHRAFSGSGWRCKTFEDEFDPAKYSEYFYFHKYVRDAIFGQSCAEDSDDVVSYYFERDVTPDAAMTIYVRSKDELKKFMMNIAHLSIRLFETGIGILTMELMNYHYPEMHDILLINDFGRRIYPQFLPDNKNIDVVKDNFLADRIEFKCGDIDSIENFEYKDFFKKELIVADYINKLLGNEFTKRFEPIPVIDDRMFVACWFGSDSSSNSLQEKKKTGDAEEMAYNSSDEWYKFIFIDGKNIGCANERMKRELIKRHTYDRWIEYGTFFGITRDSLMCITKEITPENSFPEILRKHMERMYYQIAIILLAQRASILKFSADVASLSSRIRDFIQKKERGKNKKTEEFENIAEDVKELHASYIRFVNRLWFAEVTPQEQGIEMYEMALEAMGLKNQIDELKAEIKELYEFVDMHYEKEKAEDDRETTRKLNILNQLAFVFLPLTVLAGIWGMNLYFINNVFPDSFQPSWLIKFAGSFVIFAITILLVYALSSNLFRVMKTDRDDNEKGIENILHFRTVKQTFFKLNVFLLFLLLVLVYLSAIYYSDIGDWFLDILRQAGK